MFKMHELRELIKLVDQSSVTEFKIKHDGYKISIKKEQGVQANLPTTVGTTIFTPVAEQVVPQVAVPTAVVPAPVNPDRQEQQAVSAEPVQDENIHTIKSPMVGTFYAAPAPDADPYVKVGDSVVESTIVCIVEAMKLMNEIEAEVSGEIVKVLVENGQLVEYGQPLFQVKP